MIAGVLTPTAGRVTGRPRVGYVPERFPPTLPFSGRDYLMHLGRAHGLRGPGLTALVEEALTRFGANDYAGSPLRQLSKGMCQKIAVGQALLGQPGLLILDEAWTGLDQAARDELDVVVSERIADGGRVIIVDHDRRRLARMVTDRWQIARGQVTVTEGPDAVAVTAAQGQSPALSTVVVVTAALVSTVSPANAAIRDAGAQPHSSAWPVGWPLIAALVLLAVS